MLFSLRFTISSSKKTADPVIYYEMDSKTRLAAPIAIQFLRFRLVWWKMIKRATSRYTHRQHLLSTLSRCQRSPPSTCSSSTIPSKTTEAVRNPLSFVQRLFYLNFVACSIHEWQAIIALKRDFPLDGKIVFSLLPNSVDGS